jgi:diaminohydroxyphosphoribosylaminopyrimidine deaminase/5-amino-6-(5-phosphoribosylamino)uracil reductase
VSVGRDVELDALELMRQAVDLAVRERPHPNPRVGSLVIDADGTVVGTGAHVRPGSPHAEVHALTAAGSRARNSTLIVTLEPCDHQGRTPRCTDAIIDAGVTRVVVGVLDPDDRVSGGGVKRLREAGLDVSVGIGGDEVLAADPGYFHHRTTGRARVIHKAALTIDGQIAAADGSSQWITSEDARADAHALRSSVDAVMVGIGTLYADDPQLDVRLPGYDGPQPRPVIIAGTRPLPPDARIWARDPVVVAPAPVHADGDVVVAAGPGGTVDLALALEALGDLGLLDVLVEGGAGISASLWEAGLVDHGVWYLAGKIAGGIGAGVFDRPIANISHATEIDIVDVRRVGSDLRVEWSVSSKR